MVWRILLFNEVSDYMLDDKITMICQGTLTAENVGRYAQY